MIEKLLVVNAMPRSYARTGESAKRFPPDRRRLPARAPPGVHTGPMTRAKLLVLLRCLSTTLIGFLVVVLAVHLGPRLLG
ncbi:hypothetical protein GCM10010428_29190 [Actinosynnema pretiosum subsp. pretiosum]